MHDIWHATTGVFSFASRKYYFLKKNGICFVEELEYMLAKKWNTKLPHFIAFLRCIASRIILRLPSSICKAIFMQYLYLSLRKQKAIHYLTHNPYSVRISET